MHTRKEKDQKTLRQSLCNSPVSNPVAHNHGGPLVTEDLPRCSPTAHWASPVTNPDPWSTQWVLMRHHPCLSGRWGHIPWHITPLSKHWYTPCHTICFRAPRPCHTMHHTLFTDGQMQTTTSELTQPYPPVYTTYLEPMGENAHTYTHIHANIYLPWIDFFLFV